MIYYVRLMWVIVIAALALPIGAAEAGMIETVPVGNTGNINDTHGDGFGAVDYQYNIGKYEVTAGQYTEFLNAVAAMDTYGLYDENMGSHTYGCKIHRTGPFGNYTYTVDAAWVNRPVNYVSWGDAARFANWLHNGRPTGPQGPATTEDGAYYLNGANTDTTLMAVTREADWLWAIPTEDEWYKAAYHKANGDTGDYYDYPACSDAVPGRDLSDVSGNNANYYGTPYPIDDPYAATVVGEFQNSESPYGTFDQGGNVREWNEANVGDEFRGMRGGSMGYPVSRLYAATRYSYAPTLDTNNIGFRVVSSAAAVPEPGSIVALAGLAIMGVLLWRRRK